MIEITEKAAGKIKEMLEKKKIPLDKGGMRFGVRGGGCSGMQYAIKAEFQPRDEDEVFEKSGIRVFVDPASLSYMDGSVIDWQYVEDLLGEGFKIDNPNVKGSCGCGTSFNT